MGNLLKKFAPKQSSKSKWFFILILLVAIGVGGFFLVRYFFFRTPDLEKGFEVWQEVTASDDFRTLDSQLYTGDGENNFMGKLMFYYTGEADGSRTYIAIMTQYQDPVDSAKTERVKNSVENMRYVRDRLQLASNAYTNFGDYSDYISKNLLFLPNENVGDELKLMIAQRSAVLDARKALVEYMDEVKRNFIPISAADRADVYKLSLMLSEVNNKYFAPVSTLLLNYMEQLVTFANLANDAILAGSDTLGAMSYRNSLYNVGLTLLEEMLRANTELPETHNGYFEGGYGVGERYLNRMYLTGNQAMNWDGLYYNFKQKFLQNIISDEKMILQYQDITAKDFKVTNLKQSGVNTFLPANNITFEDIESSMKKIVDGLHAIDVKELCYYSHEIATELATSDVHTTTVSSAYLKTLSLSQQMVVKNVFTLMFGVEV